MFDLLACFLSLLLRRLCAGARFFALDVLGGSVFACPCLRLSPPQTLVVFFRCLCCSPSRSFWSDWMSLFVYRLAWLYFSCTLHYYEASVIRFYGFVLIRYVLGVVRWPAFGLLVRFQWFVV